ncbi:hypothetical protein AAFF_G00399450 [Aldrovandia affinis]|uniref:Uncharacterized protein n=1 Tax=Aldrovandia affinis TaxID=143900 RepID=A0AAD7SF55_9TELE|nr:hypothetical protein AAFF_G00399450 [Aldrovandia affinis]
MGAVPRQHACSTIHIRLARRTPRGRGRGRRSGVTERVAGGRQRSRDHGHEFESHVRHLSVPLSARAGVTDRRRRWKLAAGDSGPVKQLGARADIARGSERFLEELEDRHLPVHSPKILRGISAAYRTEQERGPELPRKVAFVDEVAGRDPVETVPSFAAFSERSGDAKRGNVQMMHAKPRRGRIFRPPARSASQVTALGYKQRQG